MTVASSARSSIDTGAPVAEIPAHSSGIKRVTVSPDTGDILSAAYDQRILVWDANDMSLKLDVEFRPSIWERSFNWTADGQRLLAGTFDGTVLVWDATTGKCLGEAGERGEGNACFNDVGGTPDGDILTVSDDGLLRIGLLTPAEAPLPGQHRRRRDVSPVEEIGRASCRERV